jgi:asparagine synthase (glutamine-hydrolysing)
VLVLEGRRREQRRYWRPSWGTRSAIRPEQARRDVRRLVEAAVERRLEADVPLGVFLSGGIDSTIVAGVMAQKLGSGVKTFSIGFGDAQYDETRYARIAARAFDSQHTEFVVEPSAIDLVDRLVELHDGPFGDASAIPTSIVSMLTRQHVTVALTGDGGDELFCGYARFLAAEVAERLPLLLRHLGGALARHTPSGMREKALRARARRFFSAAALPLGERLVGWSSLFALELPELLHGDVAAALGEPFAWSRELATGLAEETTLATILRYNFESYLPYDLLVKADRSSMAHSLELRSPFLDTALIEYVAALPDGMKRRGWQKKWILRQAFSHLLPPEIMRRSKMGFSVPLGAWFRGDLRSYLRDQLAPGARLFDYVRQPYVARLLAEHESGRADHGQRLWLLLTLQVWLTQLTRQSSLARKAS